MIEKTAETSSMDTQGIKTETPGFSILISPGSLPNQLKSRFVNWTSKPTISITAPIRMSIFPIFRIKFALQN